MKLARFSGTLKHMKFHGYLEAFRSCAPTLLRRLVYAGGVLALVLAIVAVLVIDVEPVIWQKTATPQHYLAATQNILHNTTTPSDRSKDKVRVISLSGEDLTSVANYLMMRKSLNGFAQASIDGKRLVIFATVKLPLQFSDYYLNLKLIADDAEPMAFIKQVKAGYIALPKPLVRVVVWWLLHTTKLGHYAQLTLPLVQEVRIGDGRFRLALSWDSEIMGRVQDLVADLADKERLRMYYAKLAETLAQSQTRRFVGLATLTRPLFELAKQRSEAEGADAREENRALILVLAAYANGKDLAPAIYTDSDMPDIARREVLLNRRVDAAQHFTVSSLLSVSGQRAFVDIVGLAKEFNDTHGGSGFSFIDLAADRAGTIFGKMAVGSEESARRVQDVLSKSMDESVFMPATRDLPENLGAEDFASQYGNTESPEFQELKKTIEERIAACRLYQ